MLKMKKKIVGIIGFLALSFLLTSLSFFYQRHGPEFGYLGNECAPDCIIHKLHGGWPFPFVFDSMGISVLNTLFIEDEFRIIPFIVDILFYWIALISGFELTRRILQKWQISSEQESQADLGASEQSKM